MNKSRSPCISSSQTRVVVVMYNTTPQTNAAEAVVVRAEVHAEDVVDRSRRTHHAGAGERNNRRTHHAVHHVDKDEAQTDSHRSVAIVDTRMLRDSAPHRASRADSVTFRDISSNVAGERKNKFTI